MCRMNVYIAMCMTNETKNKSNRLNTPLHIDRLCRLLTGNDLWNFCVGVGSDLFV